PTRRCRPPGRSPTTTPPAGSGGRPRREPHRRRPPAKQRRRERCSARYAVEEPASAPDLLDPPPKSTCLGATAVRTRLSERGRQISGRLTGRVESAPKSSGDGRRS